jgi:DNA-binding ferritin-like protein
MKLIAPLLKIQNQLRVYHWQSDTYAQHKAFGKAYETLDGLIDSFVEVFMGKNGKTHASVTYNFEIGNLDENYLTVIDSYISFLIDFTNVFDPELDTDLLNIRDEMLATLHRLKYLLSLK